MTAKEYLKQAKSLDMLIKAKQAELDDLRSMADSISSPQLSDKVQSGSQNKAMCIVDKIVDLENKIDDEMCKLVDLKEEIHSKIANVYNIKFIALLMNVYINGFTLEETAEIMEVSYITVCRWHGEALQIFRKENNMT